MKQLYGASLIAWGLIVLFVLPDTFPPRLANYTIIGLYIITIFWWMAHLHIGWTAYWLSATAITSVVTFLSLVVKE